MYFYIYDNFLADKKYQTQLYKIENRLVDLGIKGRTNRMTLLKNMSEVVNDGIRQGAKTIVVIGNDSSFSKIINLIVDLGLIPIDGNSKIARLLGMPAGAAACEVLAQRIIKNLDLGLAGKQYFLDSASVEGERVNIKFNNWTIQNTDAKQKISFNNLGVLSNVNKNICACDPTDGRLELVIEEPTSFFKSPSKPTIIKFSHVLIECTNTSSFLITDESTKLKMPLVIQVASRHLKVIVGSGRLF